MPDPANLSFLVLMLTNRCNLACVYCYAGASPQAKDDMELETALSAIKRLALRGQPFTVELAGGEPLLRFDLIKELVPLARKTHPKARFALQTNGLLLNETHIDFFKEHRIGLGLSMDGLPKINDRLRGASPKVIKALDLLDQKGVGVNITVVLTRHNIDKFSEFLLFLASKSCVRVINLDMVRPLGRARETSLAPSVDQIKNMASSMVKTLDFINQRRFPPLKVRELDQIRRRKDLKEVLPYCMGAQAKGAAVTPKGDIYACASLMCRKEYLAGNIIDEKIKNLKELTQDWGLPEDCLNCSERFICRGGCPSRRIAYGLSANVKCELDCALRKALHRSFSA